MKSAKEIIEEYKLFLLKTHSPITVKNYISDIYHFTYWFASYFDRPFSFDLLSKNSISEYKRLRGSHSSAFDDMLSEPSIQRHLSSLRSFCSYLKEIGIASENPFDVLALESMEAPNPWKITEFKQFLLDKKSSDLTIKYYINDIKGFKAWVEQSVPEAKDIKSPVEIFKEDIVLEYKNRLTHTLLLSPLSINRKLSSIRNYASFLKLEFTKTSTANISKASAANILDMTIGSLAVETEDQVYSPNPFIKTIQKTKDVYLGFEEKAAQSIAGGIINAGLRNSFEPKDYDKRIQTIDEVLNTLKHKNIKREYFAPMTPASDLPLHKKALHHIRHTRPKWYKNYHTYPFVHYVHFGLLIGAAVIAGFFVYNETLGRATADSILQALKPQTKILTFKGKLLDKNNMPITTASDVRFGLYTSPTDGDSTLIWQETQSKIQPEEDGSINLIVGSKNPIPEALTNSETPLFLGVKIGDSEELAPRKPIGSAFASNTETVQGMLPITSADSQKNVLLALDGSGNLSIGGVANPTFQATGGDFTFSGETLILATNPSSNGNIMIAPDGNGKIEVGRAIITNTKGVNFGLQNVVEIEGGLGINATSSAHAALLINQNSRGDLLSASTGGLAKFVVDNQGSIIKGSWAGDFIPTTHGGLGANIAAVTAGEILYSISSTKYGTLKAGIQGQCLTSQGINSPLWSSCGGLTQLNGSLFTANTTLDFLVGAAGTQSAKFAFVNMNSGTPTFKIGSALGIDTNGLIQAYNGRDLIIGSTSTKNVLLAASGNVGIGNTAPTRTLDVTGTFGGNVELYVDGEGTRDVTISGKALIYDLEKNGGNPVSPEETRYNITGLPEVDGTIAYLYLKASKSSSLTPTQTVKVKINGFQIAAVNVVIGETEAVKHLTILRSNSIWHVQGDPGLSNDANADVAEWTEFEGKRPIAGEIVSISQNGKLVTSTKPHDTRLAGVVSTSPNITIGPRNENSVRLALSGRIPVIVTTVNGEVRSGDPVTSSLLPGIGMKPTKNSPIIGRALSSFPEVSSCKEVSIYENIIWPEDNGTNNNKPCFKVPASSIPAEISNMLLTKYGISSSDYIYVGKVMVLASLSWSQTDNFLSSTEGITVSENEKSVLSEDTTLATLMDELQGKSYSAKVGGRIVDELGAFSKLTSAIITSGLITTKNAAVSGTLAAYNIVADKVSATNARIEILTAGTISADSITSPLARVQTLQTDTIEPISEDLQVKLPGPSSEFQVTNEQNEIVSSLDSAGNATFSGNVISNNVNTNDASISGTLRAKKLIADDIEGLENQVTSFATRFLDDYENTASIPSYELGESILTASVSASFGTFHHGLISLGASTFGSLTAIDQVSIGTDFVLSEGGINTLGRNLELQPLRQGAIVLMAGAVTIQTDGKLVVSEDAVFAKSLTVEGSLIASSITNLPGKDIRLNLESNGIHDSSFMIHNSSSGSAVFSVNSNGNVNASGSARFAEDIEARRGTFSKLNLQLVGTAIAANDLEAYATTSAGTAFLKAYRPELTIHNNNVTDKSLIYITPMNNTDNQVLYLIRQVPSLPSLNQNQGSFTVGVSQVVDHDVQFNWLIVN